MRLVFAGTPALASPTLQALADDGHEIVGVLTRPDAPQGRRRTLTASPIADTATELGLPLRKTRRLDTDATEWVRKGDPDLGVIVAFGGLVREPLLSMPRLGWINLHFSALPRWRGAAPVQRALAAGEQRLGLTVFRLVEELDAGPVLARDSFEVEPGTPAGTVLARLGAPGAETVRRAIRALLHDPHAGTAQEGQATYAEKLQRADGRLDLTRSAAAVLAQWAGMTPEPGAFVQHEDTPVKILRAAPHAAVGDEPGLARVHGGAAVLSLSGGALELVEVQPAGKPPMAGAAWLRGRSGSAVLT